MESPESYCFQESTTASSTDSEKTFGVRVRVDRLTFLRQTKSASDIESGTTLTWQIT